MIAHTERDQYVLHVCVLCYDSEKEYRRLTRCLRLPPRTLPRPPGETFGFCGKVMKSNFPRVKMLSGTTSNVSDENSKYLIFIPTSNVTQSVVIKDFLNNQLRINQFLTINT